MRSSLRTPTAPCVSGAEVHSDVDGPPCSVLLHRPEHQQDVPDIQGEQCLPDFIFLSFTFFQPVEFTQLEHEKWFRTLLIVILFLISFYVVLFFLLAQIIEPGVLFKKVNFLRGNPVDLEDDITKLSTTFFIFSGGITALAMTISEICAWVMRPASTFVNPVCSAGFIVNSIPFFTLNTSIVLAMVVRVVTNIFFGRVVPFWLINSVVITAIFLTNKLARAHVQSRLQQQIDTLTIGGNNTVHPAFLIAVLPIRSPSGDSPTLPRRATRPAEDIFLQPLRVRALTGDFPTLPAPTRATLCPVGE